MFHKAVFISTFLQANLEFSSCTVGLWSRNTAYYALLIKDEMSLLKMKLDQSFTTVASHTDNCTILATQEVTGNASLLCNSAHFKVIAPCFMVVA